MISQTRLIQCCLPSVQPRRSKWAWWPQLQWEHSWASPVNSRSGVGLVPHKTVEEIVKPGSHQQLWRLQLLGQQEGETPGAAQEHRGTCACVQTVWHAWETWLSRRRYRCGRTTRVSCSGTGTGTEHLMSRMDKSKLIDCYTHNGTAHVGTKLRFRCTVYSSESMMYTCTIHTECYK